MLINIDIKDKLRKLRKWQTSTFAFPNNSFFKKFRSKNGQKRMDDWPDIWDIPEFANIMKCIKIFSQDFDLNPSMIQVQHKKMDLDP